MKEKNKNHSKNLEGVIKRKISELLNEYMKDIFAFIDGKKKITALEFPVFDCDDVAEKIMRIIKRVEREGVRRHREDIDYFSPYQQWTRWEQNLRGIDNYGEISNNNKTYETN